MSISDPTNKKVWSGTHYSIYKVLKSIGEVEILGPYEPKAALFILKVINQISLNLFNKRISYRHGWLLSKLYGAHFTKKLKNKSFDYIIAPAASSEIAHLKTNIPIIYITDGTFNSCLNYHDSLKNLTTRSEKMGEFIERTAISKSKQVIVSSEWAYNSVTAHYGKDANLVSIIPFGANFDKLPEEEDIHYEISKPFKLLFVGVHWKSKGGAIALNAFLRLVEKHYSMALTIVGCEPPFEITYPNLTIIKFIDKNSDEGQQALAQLYKEHHLLLLPTRFDCTPIVINEASAFGLPSLVSKTGGVQGHLKSAVNGYLIKSYDEGELFAEAIETLMNNPDHYIDLRRNSRDYYNNTLNWDHWKKEFLKILNL